MTGPAAQDRPYRSVPAGALLVRPGGAGRAVDRLDVAQTPADLGGGVGLPVRASAGHLGAGQRLRDAVGARVGLLAEGFQPLSRVPQALQAAELARTTSRRSRAWPSAICCGDPEGVAESSGGALRAAGAALWLACLAAAAPLPAGRRRGAAPPAGRLPGAAPGRRAGPAPAEARRTRRGRELAVASRGSTAVPRMGGPGRVAGWAWPSGAAEATPEATATVATAVTPTTAMARLGGLRCLDGFSVLARLAMHGVVAQTTKVPSFGRSDTRSAVTRDTACRGRARARAEARGCAAGQGDTLREGNHHTRRVLSVNYHAWDGRPQIPEMTIMAVWPISQNSREASIQAFDSAAPPAPAEGQPEHRPRRAVDAADNVRDADVAFYAAAITLCDWLRNGTASIPAVCHARKTMRCTGSHRWTGCSQDPT